MAEIIRMPRLSDTMEEGVIVSWSKKVGDQVSPGDILAEVETDKATMDLESFYEGKLIHIAVEEGPVPVDGVIAIIGGEDDDVDKLLKEAGEGVSTAKEKEVDGEEASQTPAKPDSSEAEKPKVEEKEGQPDDKEIKASPLARKMARETGVDLFSLKGSGEHGRIIKRDIESAAARSSSDSSAKTHYSTTGSEDIPVSQLRKTVAKRLSQSKFSAPHFYLTMKIDMTEAFQSRKQINEMVAPDKVSFNDLIVKACAMALKKHPEVNSSWLEEKIRRNFDVHIGVAVAIEDGLIVPVIRHADQKSLTNISAEIQEKAKLAREKRLPLDDMQGNTFSVSNLGMFGIEEFTAIINPPDACILAIGGIEPTPVVIDEDIRIRQIMKVTLSCDHRVVDGATGAQFLSTLKSLLEYPVRMLA